MKRTPIQTSISQPKTARGASDTLCKRLAEEYPGQFARWLFGAGGKVKVEKTELSREPIRADSVIFSRDEKETLHAEFQTTAKSKIPMPLRLLDYYVGCKRQNPDRRVRQAVVVLKPTNEEIPDRYEDEMTLHRYGVVKLWEQDPAPLLAHEGCCRWRRYAGPSRVRSCSATLRRGLITSRIASAGVRHSIGRA